MLRNYFGTKYTNDVAMCSLNLLCFNSIKADVRERNLLSLDFVDPKSVVQTLLPFFFLNFLFHLFSKFTLSIFSLSLPLSLSFSVHPLHLYRRCFLFPSHFFSALDETLTRRCPPFFCSNPQEFSPFLLKSAGVLDETPVTIKRSHPLLPSPFFPLKPCSGSSRMLPSAAAKFVREQGIRSDQKEEKR